MGATLMGNQGDRVYYRLGGVQETAVTQGSIGKGVAPHEEDSDAIVMLEVIVIPMTWEWWGMRKKVRVMS